MAAVVWVRQSHGLTNKIDPSRILYDQKSGVAQLSEAYNVKIDITGAISRRGGFTATDVLDSCHSIFFGGFQLLSVLANNLCLLGEDNSVTVLRGITGTRLMSYCQVGDSVLYMNGTEKGVVKNGVSWVYEKPLETRYPDKTRAYDDPPLGGVIRIFSGRVYVAEGNILWYSEPFAPNLFRKASNYISFAGRIVMIAPVLGGLFVSTTSRIYFLAGTDPKKFELRPLTQYPAIEGTDVEIDGIALNAGKISPLPMQMFTTTQGICAGTASGELVNLTYDVLTYPKSLRGTAVYTGTEYIVSLEA